MKDWRNIRWGNEIPSENYCDQPYVVKLQDGAWLCVLTTSPGLEGEQGQHIVSYRTHDRGETWEPKVDVEESGERESSYAVLLKTGYGRVYCFYNYNSTNLRSVRAGSPAFIDGTCKRVDTLGAFVFRYTDDGGKTWSAERYEVPVREFDVDRRNPYGGDVRFFWNVGRAFTLNGSGYVPLHKVGAFSEGFMLNSQGVLLKSHNIMIERDPVKLEWETLPDGDHGLGYVKGGAFVADEHNCVTLSDGSIYCVYRSVDGHPICCYSRDGGHTFSEPQYKTYANRRVFNHPRAANFVWKCSNGKYLYWFHNHYGKTYDGRNPAWISGGIERPSPEGNVIEWFQPEILLYDENPHTRMSYPDLIEEDGCFYITETKKDMARMHKIDPSLLEGLWGQSGGPKPCTDGVIAKCGGIVPDSVEVPLTQPFIKPDHTIEGAPMVKLNTGFTVEFILDVKQWRPGQRLLDGRTPEGNGVCVCMTDDMSLDIILCDGQYENHWHSDPYALSAKNESHICIIIDGGPNIILYVINGVLCDGSGRRDYGWGRFPPDFKTAVGAGLWRFTRASEIATMRDLTVYNRPLRVSEAVANYKYRLAQFDLKTARP